jgi:hypothetical protein
MAYAMRRHCVVRAGNVKYLAEILVARPAAFERYYLNSATFLPFYIV